MEVWSVGDACSILVRLIFNQGIALANWTFVNNVITGVNQGVARESADIFIGNSVPVCFCFKLLLMIIILLLLIPLLLLYTAAAAINPSASLSLRRFSRMTSRRRSAPSPPREI